MWDHPEIQDLLEIPEEMEKRDHEDHQALQVCKEDLDIRDHQELPAHLDQPENVVKGETVECQD